MFHNNLIAKSATTALAILILGASAQAAAKIPNANAAELTCHRIERLVILKKIDSAFLNSIQSVTVESIPNANPGQASFKTVSFQQADSGKLANQLFLNLDDQGKALDFNVASGIAASQPHKWTNLDPVTLIEDSLHYVEQNAAKPDVSKFSTGLKSISISAASKDGKEIARIEIFSNETTQKLEIYEGLDGAIISREVIN
jgi:hypothetical protein